MTIFTVNKKRFPDFLIFAPITIGTKILMFPATWPKNRVARSEFFIKFLLYY
jgi:hypothetical protein